MSDLDLGYCFIDSTTHEANSSNYYGRDEIICDTWVQIEVNTDFAKLSVATQDSTNIRKIP